MKSRIAVLLGSALWVGAGTAATQPRPGEPTQARVWVQNRQMDERIPVSLQEVGQGVVVRAQVASIAAEAVMPTRFALQVWEYRTVVIPTGGDAAAALRAAGAEGWEATGAIFPAAGGGSSVLLKRPGR